MEKGLLVSLNALSVFHAAAVLLHQQQFHKAVQINYCVGAVERR
jgi:hypothetical protein